MFRNSRYPKAEKVFFFILAAISVIGLVTIVVAANIQSWPNSSGTVALAIDDSGGLNISGTGAFNASYTGTSSISGGSMAGGTVLYAGSGVVSAGTLSGGTLGVWEPLQGYEYKTLVFSFSSVTATGNTLAIVYPTAFIHNTAGTLANTTGGSATMTPTAGTGGVLTLNGGGGVTGDLIIGGR
jgi:hypothetical protein